MTRGTKAQKAFRAKIVGFLERYTIHYYAVVALLSLAMIPLALWVFPSTTLLLTVIVLFTGFLSALGDFSAMLIDLHQNDEIDALQDDVDDISDDGLDNDSVHRPNGA